MSSVLARYPMNNRASMRLWTNLKRHLPDRREKAKSQRGAYSQAPSGALILRPMGQEEVSSLGYRENCLNYSLVVSLD
jgi:hypothetical protein